MKHRDPKSLGAIPACAKRAAAGGCILAVGAALGALASLHSGGAAVAGESNFVRSFTHDAVSGVMLDEEIAIVFNAALLKSSVGPDTILIRTGLNAGEQARGSYVVGKFLYDKFAQRRVVIRPEAVREYFQLERGLSREDAARQASKLIKRVESTGNFKLLRKGDAALQGLLGGLNGGSRLDNPAVFGFYPSQRPSSAPQAERKYREKIAGDDALWQDYLVNGNFGAFPTLETNSEYERFYHPKNAVTGEDASTSVLRQREYRKVLIDGRSATRVMFVPDIPIRPDLTDTGYKPGVAYSIVVPATGPGIFNTVLTRDGRRPLLQRFGTDATTHFTTIPNTGSAGQQLFNANEAVTGIGAWQPPRIINQTPPNGEAFIDPTTDWEEPDNALLIPVSARRTFTIRLRFAQPIDPRTVNTSLFQLTKTKSNPGTPSETAQSVPIAVGTFLNQKRLGIVEVEVTPVSNLDPLSQYTLVASALVSSLHGDTGSRYETSFIVGPGDPPMDRIQEKFIDSTNRANPSDIDTLDLVTTALWPTPEYLRIRADSTIDDGRLTANFMPFAGNGLGTNENPLDPASPIVKILDAQPGKNVVFPTEITDAANPSVGGPIEYHYQSISIQTAVVSTMGRHPLVLRSQAGVLIQSSNILCSGQDGKNGLTNTDTVNGGPTGGLGGLPGPGGFRGGDGAGAPVTDASGTVVPDGQGNLQFDQGKLHGSDGFPGYLSTGPLTGGGGAGGFSGDADVLLTFPANDAVAVGGNGDGLNNDNPTIPTHIRQAGGGGGHATVGGNGSGSAGKPGIVHPGPYNGGQGGLTYGASNLADQPLNGDGVPVLRTATGGAGGGGGGLEDDAPGSGVADGKVGPEDSGGGGGGGGGGAVQITARAGIRVSGSQIDVRGGKGGRTFNAANSATGQGSPGGSGAGGTIYLQCYEGDIIVENGSLLRASGGDNLSSVGQFTVSLAGGGLDGNGGQGGDGFVRLEDVDGTVTPASGSVIQGVTTSAVFRPVVTVQTPEGSYPGRGRRDIFVVEKSIAYSKWNNSGLDTPTYLPIFDNPTTTEIDGTLVFDYAAESQGANSIVIECRSAPGDPARPGKPNLSQATGWTDYNSIQGPPVADKRFIQFRVLFSLPLSYTFDQPRPYVDCIVVDINLN